MSLALDIYPKLPPLAQHLVTSLRGFELRRLRYTNHTWKTLELLEESQWWAAERFADHQSERLQRIVRHAAETAPLYREKYRAAGVAAADIRGISDLHKLPILGKEEFRRRNEEAVSTAWPREKMWVAYTSGTSGIPLKAYFTHEQMQERIALLERLYRWYTPGPWRRRASFTGKLMIDPNKTPAHVYRRNLPIHQWLFSSHHLSEKCFDTYFRDLEQIQPEQVDGILSPIFVIAQAAVARGKAGFVRANAVFPTSETLWPYMRKVLGEAFSAKVANQYGSQEGSPMAYECPQGGFHICPEAGIFEILRADDSPAAPGEVGRLVVTAFFSEGTPLIRYDIGDLASYTDRKCACGRQSMLLESVHGRVDDMFYTRERGIVPRVDSAFKSIPACIRATQVAQIGIDRFEVRMAVDSATYRAEFGEEILHNLLDYLGPVDIRLKILDRVPTTAGGKIKAMVNECAAIEDLKEIRDAWGRLNAE